MSCTTFRHGPLALWLLIDVSRNRWTPTDVSRNRGWRLHPRVHELGLTALPELRVLVDCTRRAEILSVLNAELCGPVSHAATKVQGHCWQVRMDGSDGCTDLRMSIPDNSACFVRNTAKRDGSLLLIGELRRP